MNKDINLGQVDQNGFKESQSVNFAKSFLEINKKIKTHFMEMDKTPNFDGKLMIMAEWYERITVEVQIKTLPENTRKKENGNFSFTCDTKAMNCVQENVTFNPVVLLVVDISNMQLYYKILTKEYVSDLKIGNQKDKNIWLSENDKYQEDKFIKQIYHQVKITNADEDCLTKCAAIRESLNYGEKEIKEKFKLVYEREEVKGFFTTFKYCYGENKEKSILLSKIKMQYKDEEELLHFQYDKDYIRINRTPSGIYEIADADIANIILEVSKEVKKPILYTNAGKPTFWFDDCFLWQLRAEKIELAWFMRC